MALLELAEPLFQYLCRLNRLSRRAASGGGSETTTFLRGARALSLDYTVVRSEIKSLLEEMQQKGNSDGRLAAQVKKMELPLTFFVDSLVATSQLSFAAQWHQNRLAYERNELAGDERFFDLLEETLRDTSEEAADRLAVFYLCLGLGFAGMYAEQPEQLRKCMNTIYPRVRHLVDVDPNARICRDAYESVDTRDLVPPENNRLVIITALLALFSLAVFILYYALYMKASDDLRTSIEQIVEKGQPGGK